MPKFKSNCTDSIINICREDAPEYSCEKCVATIEECVENLKEAHKIWEDTNALRDLIKGGTK